MKKLILGALLVAAIGAGALLFFMSEPELLPNPTQCEKDCINDSGGVAGCVKFCKENDHYGPPQK
jgi:hypothetical protein